MKTGRVFGIHMHIDSVFFSQYCIYLLRKPMRTDMLLCDRWQTSAQACTCYYKRLKKHLKYYYNKM